MMKAASSALPDLTVRSPAPGPVGSGRSPAVSPRMTLIRSSRFIPLAH